MKKTITLIIILILTIAIPIFADEKENTKIELQKLREKVTELNNKVNIPNQRKWGNGFSIGIPVGLYGEDTVVGLDFQYSFHSNWALRIEAHIIMNKPASSTAATPFDVIATPYFGIMGKSPMILNMKFYGGFFIGFAYGFMHHPSGDAPYLTLKGLGGVEFFSSKHQAFFIEFGGGAALTNKDIDYTRGTTVSGGTRFYF